MVYLDTHVALFLFQKDEKLFSRKARKVIEDADSILLCPLAVLEIDYLREIGKIKVSGKEVSEYLSASIGLLVDKDRFASAAEKAAGFTWTRDVFDRIITAQAAVTDSILLTKDRNIRKNYSRAVW